MSVQAFKFQNALAMALALFYHGTGRAELPSGGTVVGGAASVSHLGGSRSSIKAPKERS